ncbi:RAVE complex protein Rav1 C-terminal [Phytophthora cactorum]|nr:RAVE complex protein Rav1 C-terminal [Phytophthora cactorum]
MVFRVEESIAAVRAPPPGAQADLLVCQAVFESSRYLVYASDSLLVVLVEAPPVSTPDQSKGASRFELWQVWNAQDTIRCVRFNSSKKAARGALALCIDEGRGVLLMPASATSSRVAAMADASRASTLDDRTGSRPTSIAPGSDVIPRSDYVKAHLSLHLPRWAESVRWKCDDRLLNHLEWVESGDDLFLLGAGEKLSIWKLVDDSVQVYLQRTVTLSGGGGPGMDSPLPVEPVCHFDVAPCGRFAATAGKYDRIVKVWDLGELSPHEGAPMSMFLAHTRALVSMMWSKDVNVYSARSTVATAMGLVRCCLHLIERVFGESHPSIRFGESLLARETPKAVSSINEALLSENTVMDALCLFHYGYGSLNEARRNELVSQRMDSITNAKLLGDRSGAMADTSVGEAFICGNVALEKTFVVNLLYGVLDNGDLCIFREEAVPFTVRFYLNDLQWESTNLIKIVVNAGNGSRVLLPNQESGSAGFFVEVLFQQKKAESYLQCARLKLQVETTNVRTRRRSVSYSVQSCEVCAVCRSMMSAKKEGNVQSASLSVANMTSRCLSGSQGDAGELAVKIATTNMGGRLNVFLASGSLRRLEVAFRSSIDNAGGPVTHTALFEERGVLYLLIGGKLHVAMVTPGGETKVTKSSPSDPLELRTKPSLSIAANDALKFTACYMDESNDFEELDELISVEFPNLGDEVPRKQFGQVVSLEWTPPVSPERDCELLFLSTTTIGMLKFDCSVPTNKWTIGVYLKGKENKRSGRTTYAAVSSAPARASDLFAMDFGAPRRYGASAGGADRADMLFAPQTSTLADSPASPATAPSKSKLETDEFSKFFNEHKSSLTFMTTRESKSFLAIVAGIKKTFSWERDSSRQKDEAALRFHASLLWPVDQPASDTVPQPTATDSDVPDQQPLNRATAPTQSHRVVGGLCSEQVAWGALSDFQPELLQECFPTGTMSWKEMRHLRLPFWLKSSAKLVQFTEKVAQAEYAANRDPFAVAVFYVLLGKTSLLASLFKMGNESRISELLKNNFSDLRWKNAAIKNAYVLKTKQRYELSAAFFLLGGKVTEAVSVAEQADKTLVLSFLIARISEKWDLGGQDDSLRNSGVADFSQASFTGLSTSLRGLADQFGTNSGVTGGGESSEAKNMCADFLNTTVWAKASKCGDVYMCFLVKYFLGETSNAIDILMTPPTIEMRSMFGDTENAIVIHPTIVPIKLALKEKILRLNTSAMLRLQDAGLGIPALIHQRDLASFVQDFRRERATSYAAAAFLACRQRVLVAAIGNQVDFLYAMFLKSMREAMATPASSASSTRFDLEERLNEEIQCIVRHGGDYALPSVPETSKENLEHRVRTAVVESLVHSGRLAALIFWSPGGAILRDRHQKLFLPVHCHYLLKQSRRGSLVAAVHSVVCICCRYLKNPCCLYRVLGLIFPHKDGLSSNSEEALNEIAGGDLCVTCTSLRRPTTTSRSVRGVSSLEQDIPVLYQAVCMLELELDEFTAAVKTNRLHHPMPSRDFETPLFSYCSYWGLVLVMAADAMPAHLSRITGQDIPSTAVLFKKLVEAWGNYSNGLARFALKHLLCDLAGFFFSPFSISHAPSSPSLPSSPRGSASPSRSGAAGSPRAFLADAPGSPPSPQRVNRRQLLKCECERCPWLLLVEFFTDKNELLLRLNAQLECCSEKIDEEVRWGRLPEPASRKSALTRSQKLLLSSVAENAPTFSRATNLTDQLKRRMASMPTAASVHVQCVYRSETNIKAMCFNRAAGEDAEVSVCSSKGIFRASCMDYAEGSRFQFKGMYAPPQTSFFSSDASVSSPVKRRQAPDALNSGNFSPSSSLATRNINPPSPLRNPAHLLTSPSEPKMASFKPTAVASHPFLPLFVSGNHKGRVHLWSYDRLSAVCAFQTKDIVTALVAAPACHPAGATSVAFSSTHQLLITGGAGGALSIFDMRQRRVLHTISNAHETPIKTIVLHPSGDCVLSGSAGGDVKIWSLPIFREVAFLAKVHVKPSFLGDAATNFLSDAASNVAINVSRSLASERALSIYKKYGTEEAAGRLACEEEVEGPLEERCDIEWDGHDKESRGGAAGGGASAGGAGSGSADGSLSGAGQDNDEMDAYHEPVIVVPDNQLKLSPQELNEEFSRVLTANDPNVPNNITKYNYKERTYKVDPPGPGDHLYVHLCCDGSMIHKESEDAKTQAAFDQKYAEEEKEARELSIKQAKEEAEAKGEKIDEAALQFESGKNQFNYSERARRHTPIR